MRFRRTRIAPTPSGFLHLGNIYSFAITAYLAKKHHAKLLLRIDDMDGERTRPEYLRDIFETLRFMEIPWDEGPRDAAEFENKYSQHLRTAAYHAELKKLIEAGHVFACTCSRAQVAGDSPAGNYPGTCRKKNIPFDAANACWRLKIPPDLQLKFKTYTGRMMKADLPKEMSDFVVRKKTGDPAYQFTSVMDDLLYDVDLVVRGEDLLPSTLAQFYLASLIKGDTFLNAAFHHHRLLQDKFGSKLSKSAGATSVQYLRSQGSAKEKIYQQIGQMAGLTVRTRSWAELGEAALG